MKFEKIQLIPKGLKVITNEKELAIFKYNSFNKSVFIFNFLAYLALMLLFFAFFLLNALPNYQGPSFTNAIVFTLVLAIASHIILNNIWTKITITPEYIQIKNKKFKMGYAELRSSSTNNKNFKISLQYGAETYELPLSRKNGWDIVNYINPIIVAMGTKNSDRNSIESGVREQKF